VESGDNLRSDVRAAERIAIGAQSGEAGRDSRSDRCPFEVGYSLRHIEDNSPVMIRREDEKDIEPAAGGVLDHPVKCRGLCRR
jgi:hypothetical protein